MSVVLLLLLFSSDQEKSWDVRESGNLPMGVFLPSLSAEFSRMCCFLSHGDLSWEHSDIWKLEQPLLPT